ncbi:hypothetical protein [Pseudoduganella sp. R-34]|uniref:hypothetical protein n=1 Tax=Pseudoduganella sp. R-34 TaxID=3404062 RepID=UPI003CF3A50E
MSDRSFEQIARVFENCLAQDDFETGGSDPADSLCPSMLDFIRTMAAGNAAMRKIGQDDLVKFPELTDLDQTFGHFLGMTIQTERGEMLSLTEIIEMEFCAAQIPGLARTVAGATTDATTKQELLDEFGAQDWREWLKALTTPAASDKLSAQLMAMLVDAYADRTLLSFFIQSRVPGEFSLWHPDSYTGIGKQLEVAQIDSDGHLVTVHVSRYTEVEDVGVTAYEWNAQLVTKATGSLDAAACGMAYVFERTDGVPHADRVDLITVADSVADSDVLQVKSFLDQHEDAPRILAQSDLCFVWLWERREGAPNGVGAICMRAALANLQRRFKWLRTAIFDARPAQFVNWSVAKDPPMVAVEKQQAIDSLVSYIEGLGIEQFEVKHIFNCAQDDPSEAMRAIGQEVLEHLSEESFDDDSTSFPSTNFLDDPAPLITFFDQVGIPELAEALEEEVASEADVHAALHYQFLEQRIHYLPCPLSVLSASEFFSYDARMDIDTAIDNCPEFEQFIDDLPEGIHATAAMEIEDQHGVPGWYCVVECPTVFGLVSGYFTLIPKPRPTSIAAFLV